MSEELVNALANLRTENLSSDDENGVSFLGKSLKLNDANDAKVVTDAIRASKNMEYLNLEGNTLGVEAAKAIGNAISSHRELKRALWKDIFTGRMKDEIPQALRFLGSGLDLANARLVVLDLSDNAFGPIGMQGLASLLRSAACQSLQELRLNNNGLGITGAKLLSKALTDCYNASKSNGKPLPLRVFVAGRNRLENEGITALSKVFKGHGPLLQPSSEVLPFFLALLKKGSVTLKISHNNVLLNIYCNINKSSSIFSKLLGTLEEIEIPQNGIYHKGIRELSEALKSNPKLKVLNLNDNTLGRKGCKALAEALPYLQQLQVVNLGDCLLRNAGALTLAAALELGHLHLKTFILEQNNIRADGGLAIVKSMENKKNFEYLLLDGNQFGEKIIEMLKEEFMKTKDKGALGTFSEDEGEDEEEDDSQEEEEEEESENEGDVESEMEQSLGENEEQRSFKEIDTPKQKAIMNVLNKVTAADFLQFPTPERFLALGCKEADQILDALKTEEQENVDYVEVLVAAVMKVSSLTTDKSVASAALACSKKLYQHLFTWAGANENLSLVNNALLVHMGLIKSEDKKWKPQYNQVGCLMALKTLMTQNDFPQATRDTINCFLRQKQLSIETVTIS